LRQDIQQQSFVSAATILFCDLVDFTTISQEMPADRVIDFLGRIFSEFDHLAAVYGAEKIKTIGDAYMVAAGIPEAQPDHALRIAELAIRMLETVNDIAAATAVNLQARIGVHSGPIVAGVIGTHKFAYDTWAIPLIPRAAWNRIRCPDAFRSPPPRALCSVSVSVSNAAARSRSRAKERWKHFFSTCNDVDSALLSAPSKPPSDLATCRGATDLALLVRAE
jgi:hypothetical protein